MRYIYDHGDVFPEKRIIWQSLLASIHICYNLPSENNPRNAEKKSLSWMEPSYFMKCWVTKPPTSNKKLASVLAFHVRQSGRCQQRWPLDTGETYQWPDCESHQSGIFLMFSGPGYYDWLIDWFGRDCHLVSISSATWDAHRIRCLRLLPLKPKAGDKLYGIRTN